MSLHNYDLYGRKINFTNSKSLVDVVTDRHARNAFHFFHFFCLRFFSFYVFFFSPAQFFTKKHKKERKNNKT